MITNVMISLRSNNYIRNDYICNVMILFLLQTACNRSEPTLALSVLICRIIAIFIARGSGLASELQLLIFSRYAVDIVFRVLS